MPSVHGAMAGHEAVRPAMAGQRGGEAGQKAERQQGGGSEWRVGLGQRAEGRRAGSDGREGHMGAEGR